MNTRRTTRQFSNEPVPRELIQLAIQTAATAPSGAHQQPWTFVAVSDPAIKQAIRDAAEAEERAFYHGRAPQEWIDALAPLGTDEQKSHLTDAPWVIVLFRQAHGLNPDGSKRTFYYTQESCGIAAGLFIAAVHRMGLATLTHTPNPMGFLRSTQPDAQTARRSCRLALIAGWKSPLTVSPSLLFWTVQPMVWRHERTVAHLPDEVRKAERGLFDLREQGLVLVELIVTRRVRFVPPDPGIDGRQWAGLHHAKISEPVH